MSQLSRLGHDATSHPFPVKGLPLLAESLGDSLDQFQRIVIFSDTFRGESFAWDPQDSSGQESAVYLVPRIMQNRERIAGDFLEFVGEILLGDRYHELYQPPDFDDGQDELDKVRREFVPAIGSR